MKISTDMTKEDVAATRPCAVRARRSPGRLQEQIVRGVQRRLGGLDRTDQAKRLAWISKIDKVVRGRTRCVTHDLHDGRRPRRDVAGGFDDDGGLAARQTHDSAGRKQPDGLHEQRQRVGFESRCVVDELSHRDVGGQRAWPGGVGRLRRRSRGGPS